VTAPDKITQTDSGLWKDYLDRACVQRFGEAIGKVYPSFEVNRFVRSAMGDGFETLELKARIRRLGKTLRDFLPVDYRRAIAIILDVAPSVPEVENWVLTTFVELYGVDYFDVSVRALKRLTRYGTSEFAIRPFMIQYPDRMMPILHVWAQDKNEHVRRLAAEASRPRGVWVAHLEAFKKNPEPVIELLEKLSVDPSLYVRKAVANNLNDISKDHPEIVLKTCRHWRKDGHPHTDWIIRRACRSLVKLGDLRALSLLGFTARPRVQVREFAIAPKVRVGRTAKLRAVVQSGSTARQKLAIDYRLHYVKAGGGVSPKVFKLSEMTLEPGQEVTLETTHSFRQMSTRKHYPGRHQIDLIINGRPVRSI
jgi:3-methyladenine DNA glycosylase AlkC